MKQTDVLFWVGVKSTNSGLQQKHGNFKYLDISKECWQKWCTLNNVLFYEYNTPAEEDTELHRVPWTRWFDVFDQLDEHNINYNKIAVIDGSSLCRMDTPNFFNLVGNNLVAFRSLENVKWIYQGVQGYQELFPDTKFDLTKYISCGFQIFTKKHRPFLDKLKQFYYDNFDNIQNKQRHTVKKGTDQPVYNYLLQQEGIKVDTLSPKFMLTHLNRFDFLGGNWQLKGQDYPNKEPNDTLPFFIKYGYIWFFSGMSNRGDRENLMNATWEIINNTHE